ncbi:hypothetical protein GCM10010430_71680 [Kitasatospora cystarginea]|uniref:Uncharacterized protein n=1 Tax=Kitasatospora cystarginea TaxID=58350 RepID=A0ABP5RTS4_9ACTN
MYTRSLPEIGCAPGSAGAWSNVPRAGSAEGTAFCVGEEPGTVPTWGPDPCTSPASASCVEVGELPMADVRTLAATNIRTKLCLARNVPS